MLCASTVTPLSALAPWTNAHSSTLIAPAEVFDRFYRTASARTLPSSGLRLAIVRQIAQAHGGTVTAAHAAGGGAILTLSLPAPGNGG
jgi:signal transduction histidine kinase